MRDDDRNIIQTQGVTDADRRKVARLMEEEMKPEECGTFRDITTLPRTALPPHIQAFGKRLRMARQAFDISMGELARLLGCSVVALSDVEAGSQQDKRYKFCERCAKRRDSSCDQCSGSGVVGPSR